MVLIDGHTPLLAGALIGLAGAGHCAGMCGGLMAMLSLQARTQAGTGAGNGAAIGAATRPGAAPVAASVGAQIAAPGAAMVSGGAPPLTVGATLLLVQLGRVLAYTLLGTLAGGVLQLNLGGADASSVTYDWLQALASVTLALVGLKALGLPLERLMPLRWRQTATCGLSRLGHHIDPTGHPLQAVAVGIGWGLIPCPMVWGTLVYAALQGSALWGGAVMLGFGLGTLVVMVPMALGMPWLVAWTKRPQVRRVGGVVLLALASLSLLLNEALGLYC